MADYNPYTVGSYQQMAATMAQSGGGRNMSGLGARPSNQTDTPTGTVDFTTIDPTTGTQIDVATIDFGDGGDSTPNVIYAAAANAATQAGSVFAPQGPMANAINLYSMPNMVESASDFVYRADRDDAITSAISDVQAEEQEQINAAISSVNSAITMGKTDAEIAEAFLNDMGGFGSDKPDETGGFGVQGTTLKDVTDTQQGLMSNPQPLYDFAEEMANPSITKSELPPMSPDEQAALGEAIRKAAEDGTLSSKLSNIQFVSLDGDRTDPSYWDRVFAGETDPETGQTIKSADDVANERMSEMASQGLMSRRMDGKDGDLAASVAPFSVSEDELYNFAKEAYPDNDLAAGALLATIEAESAGGDTMLESGNYTKEAALRVANQGEFKTARKKEVEKIFKDPDLTYTDSKGRTRMTKEGQVKFFNIYYNDKYRGENYKLGNTEEGDGFRFRGRGPIQLTGKNNYKKYGDMIGVDLVQNPQLVVTDKDVALAVTKAFMKDKGLDKVSSAKGLRDIVGHADDAKLTKAKARWKRAQEIERQIMRETSPRPVLRPE